jgi:hypothetical protein
MPLAHFFSFLVCPRMVGTRTPAAAKKAQQKTTQKDASPALRA